MCLAYHGEVSMANLSCELDEIKNHLRDGPVGIPVGDYLDRLRWEDSPTVGGAIPWAGIPDCVKRRK